MPKKKKQPQKSLQDYPPNMKKPASPHNALPTAKNWILSRCKYLKTRSFDIDGNGSDGEVVNEGGVATLADVDRFLFENFRSLYLKDDCEDGEISSRGSGKRQDEEGESRMPDEVVMFDSPRLIYPPLSLRGSKRFFVAPGSSGSLMEEARSSLTMSKDVYSSSASLTTNTVATTATTIASAVDPTPKDESPRAVEGVKLLGDCIAVIKKTRSPYQDFKRSMQDMVESRTDGPVDWEFMEELLLCYLGLNSRESHKYILGAFVDLVVAFRRDSDHRVTSRSRDVRSNNNNNGRIF